GMEWIQEALNAPAPLDMKRVEAQQARRILDRLVGYQVSPMLWKPIRPGLSAGRVQTVALRLICEREDEVRAFVEQEYWSITAHLMRDEQSFEARLHQIDGKKFTLGDEDSASEVVRDVADVPFTVTEVKRRERRKNHDVDAAAGGGEATAVFRAQDDVQRATTVRGSRDRRAWADRSDHVHENGLDQGLARCGGSSAGVAHLGVR
ncbi:MAG TPA: hypothetical protein EYQ27_16135, partial [Gemmatimonadetes bacterium]|nr:hypothetical protein [Gemmatimonadota bacterium]